jgi:HAD superfamily hydrolase (TIGR01509 family)
MKPTTVIFDMDGLLIDSEPLWEEAGKETMAQYGVTLTNEQYHFSTGLRTKEWVDYWFTWFNIDKKHSLEAELRIVQQAISKIGERGIIMPGVEHILQFFRDRKFKIGLATSSPLDLVRVVADKLQINDYLQAIASAGELPYGKPHPQVYLNCAKDLEVSPLECICFEDSFNGMIAVKAARMKCVVIPAQDQQHQARWDAADMKLPSLLQFNEEVLARL